MRIIKYNAIVKKTQIYNTHLCKDTNYINSVYVAYARPDPAMLNLSG